MKPKTEIKNLNATKNYSLNKSKVSSSNKNAKKPIKISSSLEKRIKSYYLIPKTTFTVNNNNNNNINSQVMKKQNPGSNTIMIKPLPGDSFDKKSQVIKLTKADMVNISQKETSNKVIDKKNKFFTRRNR